MTFVFRLALISLVMSAASALAAAERPNVLVFYLDDMGWAQPGCCGGTLAPTPHIDALAAAGVRFTNGYVSACVCAPSRVGLMTGRYQSRTGHDANTTNRPGSGLLLSETTLAQRMKAGGYSTGIVGKWHLGTEPGHLPASRGFDVSFGSVSNLGEGDGPAFYRGPELIADPPEVPVTSPLYAREAVQFLESHREQPWFLYVAFNAVHAPHVASPEWLQKFSSQPKRVQGYAANIAEADAAVGTVLAKLRALSLQEQTLVFLIADNGGAAQEAEMGGLRGRKWLLWEGGVRVPWIVAWPGRVPGGRVVDDPVIQLDVLPTALAAAGIPVQPAWELDGVNLLPLLEGTQEHLGTRPLFFRFGVQHAVRLGDWKLVKAAVDMEPMLVNLRTDPGEQTDQSAVHPQKKAELQALFDAWNSQMAPPRWEDRRWNGEEARAAQKSRKAERQKESR